MLELSYMKKLVDAPIKKGTKVFVRLDLDVPLEDGEIKDTFRLDISKETLKYLISKGADITIAGHLGRPGGKFVEELSSKHLEPFFDEFFNNYPYKLLENLRFDSREKENDPSFAKELIKDAELYVNESFANSHREHCSMVGIPKLIPGYIGLHLQREIDILKKLLQNPKRPFLALIGGAKIETKKPVIDKMLEIADGVLVGGKIGIDWSEDIPEKLLLPVDYARDQKDIGEKTIKSYVDMISTAKTVVWAGPMGLFEENEFLKGTDLISEAIANSTAYSVVGGGDTIAALDKVGRLEEIDFVSVGGGAMLEFLVKGTLPALEVLDKS